MAGSFFEVRDYPNSRQVVFRRISGPRDTTSPVVWLDDTVLAKLTAVDDMPYADKVTYDASLKGGVYYTQAYKPLPPTNPVVNTPHGVKVGDTATIASIFTFSDAASNYTITAAPAANADLTTTAGSVIFKVAGVLTLTAQHKTQTAVKATATIAVGA